MSMNMILRVAPLVMLLLAACPDVGTSKPAATCAKAYEKCVLANGVLGVCDPVECAPGQAAPCLVCRSQH